MIYQISGRLIHKSAGLAVLENGGVGFELFISLNSYDLLPAIGESVRLFTYLHVREDILNLYGFHDIEEKKLFLTLTSLSGIGPKNAMTMLSSISVKEFRNTILQGDYQRLTAIQGIGPKTAKRIIVELKDKLSEEELNKLTGNLSSGSASPVLSQTGKDAVTALEALGFRKADVLSVVEAMVKGQPEISTEDIIRTILKNRS